MEKLILAANVKQSKSHCHVFTAMKRDTVSSSVLHSRRHMKSVPHARRSKHGRAGSGKDKRDRNSAEQLASRPHPMLILFDHSL